MADGRGGRRRGDPWPSAEADEARRALARVVASDSFRNAPQLIAFLTYVVEKTLAGEAADIKGYTIATQALGRGPEFDPQSDPIVRVEAGRLRKALHAFYHDSGGDDPVRIVIPRGSYVPRFEPRDEGASEAAPVTVAPVGGSTGVPADEAKPVPAARPAVEPDLGPGSDGSSGDAPVPPPRGPRPLPTRAPRPLLATAAGLLLLILIGAVWLVFGSGAPSEPRTARTGPAATAPPAPPSDRTEGRAVVVVAPLETSGTAPDGFSPPLLRSRVVDGLARFDEVAVVDGAVPDDLRDVEGSERYVLNLRVSGGASGAGVAVRLTHQPGGQVVWSREFDPLQRADPDSAAEFDAARQIATTVGQPYGVLFSDLRSRPSADPRIRCLVWAYDYWRHPAVEAHARARDCLEKELADHPSMPSLQANLTFFYLDEYRAGYNPRPDALDRALKSARRAVEIGPESARAHQALMAATFARGDTEGALQAGRRALELNPYDMDIVADVGARLVQTGRYREGAAMILRAAAANPTDPPWYDFFLFVAHTMLGETPQARAAAGRIVTDDYAPGLVARAIVASEEGDGARAKRLIEKLVALQPDFAKDARGVIARRRLSPETTDRLVAALRTAGLDGNAGGR